MDLNFTNADIDVPVNPAYGLLKCPCCGSEYLHQTTVCVYNRSEDAPMTHVTEVKQEGRTEGFKGVIHKIEPSFRSGNPSGRRQGLTIFFECESCHGEDNDVLRFALDVYQHKGNTYLEWRC
jgi:hypothetical protein